MTPEEAINILKAADPLRITISGDIGAGKSTFAKRLASDLDIPRLYAGEIFRKKAAERGMTTLEFQKLLETDESVDREVDEYQKETSKTRTRGVFEGRTSWHFVVDPKVTVFLSVSPEAGAERIWNEDGNHLRDTFSSLQEVIDANEQRKQSEIKRYKNYFNIDAYDHQNFNVIINADDIDQNQVYEQGVIKIAEFIKTLDK